jgi:patatin-related protein
MSVANGGSGAPVKEVRIALVCYGGVSLAIYMHGVTRELHRLITASNRLDEDGNPFEAGSAEHVYWKLLRDLAARDGVRTRVVVDVISGTSAGGINGVFLAKAVAHDLSQESLRDLWFAEADVSKLLAGPRFLPVRGRLAWFAVRALARRLRVAPPLRGDHMCRVLYSALSAMDQRQSGAPRVTAAPESRAAARGSLLPESMSLELFVTATDVRGHRRYIPITNRVAGGDEHRVVSDLTHRHVMRFSLDPRQGRDDFAGRADNIALGFSARATSSFPGAFPPISLADFMREIGSGDPADAAAIEREFFRAYQLSMEGPRNTYFIDGGVLDNFPFGHAIDAITRKPASSEVKRWLVYIEPDPSLAGTPSAETGPAAGPPAEPPAWVNTIVAGLSSIPSKEPIIDELGRLRTFNERIAYIADLARTNYPAIQAVLREADHNLHEGGDLTEANVGHVNTKMNELAMERLGSGYRSYVRLKLQRAIDDLAEIVARTWAYPPDSGQASFVRTVMLAALDHRFPAEGQEVLTEQVKAFLRTFDLAFTERRLRFVIQGVNEGYQDGGAPSPEGAPQLGPPGRGERELLDTVKHELYGMIEELWNVVSPTTIADKLGDEPFGLFSDEQLADPLRREVSPQAFAQEHDGQLDALLDSLKGHLDTALESFPNRLWARFVEMTSGWAELQQLLLVRFLGFPIWDTLILPIVELSGVRQFSAIDVVRISPLDGDPKRLPPKQLMGAPVHHFAAFFARKAREHDFLWGRLDGAEQLLNIVAPDLDSGWYRDAFQAVLDEEEPSLTTIGATIQEVRARISTLGTVTEPTSDTAPPQG